VGLSDGLVAIKDGEAFTGFYSGNGGVYSIKNPGTREAYKCHVYSRLAPDGKVIGMMEFPLAPPGGQTVGRTTSGGEGGLSVDLYLAKRHVHDDGSQTPAFRYAEPADVIAMRSHVRENEAKAAAKAKANDPMHRDERMANMLADAIRAAATTRDSGGRAAR
jgi:hypothetical protein